MSQHPLTVDDAFALLATSNRFADARATDGTLRTYIGQWRNGLLSRQKKQAMLLKYNFKEVSMPMFMPPVQNPNPITHHIQEEDEHNICTAETTGARPGK